MIAQEIAKLLDTVKNYTYPSFLIAHEHEPRIVVGTIVSRAAQYYEKARYSVDYTEEHLLRRTAIERILRRRLTIEFTQGKNSRSFIVELIEAGYLPNDELPERIIVPVQEIIDKTIFVISLFEHIYTGDQRNHLRSLAIKLATSEIDELLFPSIIDDATLKAFYRTIKDHVKLTHSDTSSKELEIQTYLACRRGLFKENDAILFYKLWLLHYPNWTDLNHTNEENDEELKKIAEEFSKVSTLITEQLESPIHKRYIPKIKNDIIYFSVIRKIVAKYQDTSEDILRDSDRLRGVVQEIVEGEYTQVHQRIRKTSWNAVMYILITKVVLALAIELPYDILVAQEIHYVALATNIIFHPLLLFAITTTISHPDKGNTARIVAGISSIVYKEGHSDITLKATRKKPTWQYVAGAVYLILFAISFGSILWLLNKLGFNLMGIAFFIFFLTFVSYFGLRIRYLARRWVIQTESQGFWSFVWDMLTLPIISLGRWLTEKFASINIFVFILDFIIEAPFKLVLRAIDTFALFIKEKKDEIY
jgi:hypothetical protein